MPVPTAITSKMGVPGHTAGYSYFGSDVNSMMSLSGAGTSKFKTNGGAQYAWTGVGGVRDDSESEI